MDRVVAQEYEGCATLIQKQMQIESLQSSGILHAHYCFAGVSVW